MTIKDELNQVQIKYSRQREAILSLLKASELPLTLVQIRERLQAGGIRVDLSTIYRNLDTMVNKNLIRLTYHMENSQNTYDYNRHDHRHYLICQNCHKITVLESCPLHHYEEEIEDNLHYKILGHQLELYGICPDCQAIMSRSNSNTTGQ